MNEDSGLLLPNIVPIEKKLILSPEAERERMLAAIEAEEAEAELRADVPLAERVRIGICKGPCGKQQLLFLPAKLCEKCLRKAAEEAGLEMPAPAPRQHMNRVQRRKAGYRRGR